MARIFMLLGDILSITVRQKRVIKQNLQNVAIRKKEISIKGLKLKEEKS